MAFLGILGKSDTGLKPIVQRAIVTAVPASSASTYLVASKAVVRAPVVPPKVELPPPPLPPPTPPTARPPVRIAAPPAPAPKRASPPAARGPSIKPVPAAAPAIRGADLVHLRQGVVLQARGEHPAAIEAFTKAIAADAGCIEAYAGRGISREALGDVAGARADYAKSIEVEVKAGIARHLATAPEL